MLSNPAAQPAAASGLGTTIDLSTGTEINTGVKGAGTSLGTTSTLQAAATHGALDGGFDAYCNFVNIGAAPDNGQRTLCITMSVGTLPTETPNNNAFLLIIVSNVAAIDNLAGYAFGIARNSSGHNKAGSSIQRFRGSNPGLGDVMAGTPVLATMTVGFDLAGEAGILATGLARGDTSGTKDVVTTSNLTGTFSDVFVGVALCQIHSTPSTVVTWDDVKLTYSWT